MRAAGRSGGRAVGDFIGDTCMRMVRSTCLGVGLAGLFTALPPDRPTATAQAVATPPSVGPAPKLTVPAVQRAVLPNGITLEVAEMHEVPLVQASLVITGGARLDGDRPGLATFVANMLDEGAGTRDAFELAAEVEFLGASLGTGASWDATTVFVGAPKRTFEKAMALAADVVLRPRFNVADVKRQRDLRLSAILQQRDQPASVANLVFAKAVYQEGHPYHQPIGGDSASTAGLDSATVRTFWRRAADPRRARLIVAGDITMAEARALARRLFGAWRAPARPLAVPAAATIPVPPRPATRVILVDKPGAAQSVISIGAPGVDRSSPDYPAITLMNTILGGSFSSRVNDVLREQRGYTYGAGTGYTWRPLAGPFVASSAVRSNVTDSALAVFFSEFRRIRDSAVTDVELQRGRSYLTLGALGDFETTGQVAGQLASLATFGLPLSTIPKEMSAIERVTAADVQRAARRYLDPDHLTVVVVGDIASIRPGIEALNLGPVTVQDYNGNEVLK